MEMFASTEEEICVHKCLLKLQYARLHRRVHAIFIQLANCSSLVILDLVKACRGGLWRTARFRSRCLNWIHFNMCFYLTRFSHTLKAIIF